MKAAIFLTLVASLLVGCAPEGDLADLHKGPPFVFDVSALPAAYQPWFQAAADEWNMATGRDLVMVDANGPNQIEPVPSLPSGIANTRVENDHSVIRYVAGPWGACEFSLGEFQADFRTVIAHELGHALGVYFANNPTDPVHSPDPSDLMAAESGPCRTVSAADVSALPF